MDDVLARLLDNDGRVIRWPLGKGKTFGQAAIVAYLATKFETGRVYTEREVNDLLNQWHTFGDWAMLRRELYDRGFLNRQMNGTQYRLRDATASPLA